MKRNRQGICAVAAACATVMLPSHTAAQISEAAGLRAAVPFEVGRLDLRVGAGLHRVGSPSGLRTPYTLESTFRLPFTSSGLWLGSGIEGAGGVDSLRARPFLTYGAWRSFQRIQVSVGATSHMARVGGRPARLTEDTSGITPSVVDPAEPSRLTYWSDVEGRLAWRLRALTMEAIVGARAGVQSFVPTVWGRLGGSYPLSSRFAITGAVGAEPARFGLGLPASNFVSVALRVRPWRASPGTDTSQPAAFIVRSDSAGSYRIAYTVGGASKVELSGDFDAWRPLPLTETRTGVWETTLALKPGTYHVNVRVNGGRWLPPPGLPQAEDDFNGAVGVLVVR